MPTVPSYDLPTQELASVQLNTFQAPNVQPMSDIAGKQIQTMGQATMSAGQQFKKTADSIVDEIRDANVKKADTDFLGRMQDILYNKESGYMWKKNKDAMDGYASVNETFQKAAGEVRDTLKDPVERAAFEATVSRHAVTFNGNVSRHAGEQTFNYRKTEAEARMGSYNDAAIAAFGKPEFQTYLKTAHSEINAMADMAGLGEDARKAAILKSNSYVYNNVVTNLMLNNKYAEARSVLDGAIKDGNISQEAALSLNRSLIAGFNKEEGKRVGQNIFSQRGPVGSDANEIISWVMKNHEGVKLGANGEVVDAAEVANDAGKGLTRFGINQTANPDIDVKNLTMDKAIDIYKQRYWNGIGADKLAPEMRGMAFDAAVNQGVGWTNKALAEANGDPQKFLELRRARYEDIARNDKSKAQYLGGWLKRVDAFQAGINGDSSLSGMLRQTEAIDNPEIKQLAQAEIKHLHSEKRQIEAADYSDTMNQAMDIAYSRDGGWSDIPAPLWGKLKFEDQQKLINRPKTDNTDVVIDLKMHPEKMKKGVIEQYRPMLTESTYQQMFTLANGNDGEGKIIAASVDSQQMEEQLRKSGMTNLMGTPKSDTDKQTKVQLIATVERMIDAEQRAKGGKPLSQEEKIKIQQIAIRPVTVSARNWYNGSTTMEKRFFQVEDPRNVQIPDAAKAKILRDFEKGRIPATPANILNAYLSMDQGTDLGPVANAVRDAIIPQ